MGSGQITSYPFHFGFSLGGKLKIMGHLAPSFSFEGCIV